MVSNKDKDYKIIVYDKEIDLKKDKRFKFVVNFTPRLSGKLRIYFTPNSDELRELKEKIKLESSG